MICLQHFLLSPEQQQSLLSINLIGDVLSVMDIFSRLQSEIQNNLGQIPGDEQRASVFPLKRISNTNVLRVLLTFLSSCIQKGFIIEKKQVDLSYHPDYQHIFKMVGPPGSMPYYFR